MTPSAIGLTYGLFAAGGLALFKGVRPAVAAWAVFLGGWVVLPVGPYPAGSNDAVFPYWITGAAVPSDLLWTKAWVAPAVAVLGSAWFDRAAWRRLGWRAADLPVIGWCLWPLAQAAWVDAPNPPAAVSALYLAGTWGAPWLLGRLYAATPQGRVLLARALTVSALACLPISLVEGLAGPVVYGALYGLHPFRFDGSERYLGFRPIGFFEHGNQFGLWIALCAIAAVWVAASNAAGAARKAGATDGTATAGNSDASGGAAMTRASSAAAWRDRIAAVVIVGMAIAAQSVGAILLLLAGLLLLSGARWLRPRWAAVGFAAALTVGGAVYVSGRVPIVALGTGTSLGRQVIGELRAAGRFSFAWRIAQDQKLLPLAIARPAVGVGAWDWWRPRNTRPWGLAMLLLGQFGGLGVALAFATLLWAPLTTALAAPRASGWAPSGLALMLATLAVLSAIDALLNSFLFFPAVAIAGSLAGPIRPLLPGPPVRGKSPSAA